MVLLMDTDLVVTVKLEVESGHCYLLTESSVTEQDGSIPSQHLGGEGHECHRRCSLDNWHNAKILVQAPFTSPVPTLPLACCKQATLMGLTHARSGSKLRRCECTRPWSSIFADLQSQIGEISMIEGSG